MTPFPPELAEFTPRVGSPAPPTRRVPCALMVIASIQHEPDRAMTTTSAIQRSAILPMRQLAERAGSFVFNARAHRRCGSIGRPKAGGISKRQSHLGLLDDSGNTDPTRRAPTGTLGRSFDDAVGMIRGGAIARHRHDRRLRRHLQRSDGLPDLHDLRQRAHFRCYPANRRFARHRQVNPGDAHCRDCNAIMFYRSRNSDGVQRWPGSPCTTWTKG